VDCAGQPARREKSAKNNGRSDSQEVNREERPVVGEAIHGSG
jgi:hypothetical protein